MNDDIRIELEDGLDEKGREVLLMLEKMKKSELAISAFYRECGNKFVKDRDFWHKLARAETGHSEHIEKMTHLFFSNPGNFTINSSHTNSPAMLDRFISKIEGHTKIMLEGALTFKQALYEANHIEMTLIESNISGALKSDSVEFNQLAGKIMREEGEHREAINRLITERYKQ